MERSCANKTFQRGPGLLLSRKESDQLLDLLRKARIKPFATGDQGCDGTTYRLRISRGSLSMDLKWWEGSFPEGWEDIRPLVEILDGYAIRYGQSPKPEQAE